MCSITLLQILQRENERALVLDALSELRNPVFTMNSSCIESIRCARTAGLSAGHCFGVVVFRFDANGAVVPTVALNDVIVLTRLRQTCSTLRGLIPRQTLDHSGYESILRLLKTVSDCEYFADFAGCHFADIIIR